MLFLNVKNNLIEAKISKIPKIGLYISSGNLIVPPRKANGIEVMIKGNNLFHLINPAFENLKVTIEEKISTIPKIGLYISSGKLIVPPRKANGIEVMIKGNNLFHLINPAFENLKVTIEETKIFKASAVGRITSGINPAIAIIAKYPDAPAWPTEE